MGTILTKIDKERQLKQSREITVIEKMARIHLAHDSQRPLELNWCKGRGFKNTIIVLRPGDSVVQPVEKARAWFGPFDRFEEYEQCTDEAILEVLRDHIAIESARYLMRYDYPRGQKGFHPDMNPIGPHRSPDIDITILSEDGKDPDPISLYEIYGIGDFDDLKDTWAHHETEGEIRKRMDARLREKDKEVEAMRRELAELKGLVVGRAETIAAGAKNKPVKATETAPSAL
jgi:hypothetical protein